MKYFIYCRKSQEAEDRQVLSLESQSDEIARAFGADGDIEIADRFVEAYSAKQPGRPLFTEMLRRIEKGEAEGIIAWHPDRLARNSMDGGQIIYLLDQGKLNDLKFCNYSFENSSQGKFMLNIIFGYSKYYVDNLSENVKRGQRAKLKNGWRPNAAPLGYRNCKETGEIILDEDGAIAIRKTYAWFLGGETNIAELHRRLRDELCYKTPEKGRVGGKSLSRTQVYRILCNPFYAGYIEWNGELSQGAHVPIVSRLDFEKVQRGLGKLPQTRSRRYDFTYRGLFVCGACGKAVTAERKVKPSGREYVYYHCTRVHTEVRCEQPSVEERQLTTEVETYLEALRPSPKLLKAAESLTSLSEISKEPLELRKRLKAEIGSSEKQIRNLTDLRLREIIDDTEFNAKRAELKITKDALEEKLQNTEKDRIMFEPFQIMIMLFDRAVFLFRAADRMGKRRLLKILSSNRSLIDKKALIHLAFP